MEILQYLREPIYMLDGNVMGICIWVGVGVGVGVELGGGGELRAGRLPLYDN